jgi:predicted cupin superfamily sugar epimerase
MSGTTGNIALTLASAADWIVRLELRPHPEGGHFRQVLREPHPAGGRGLLTSIYYLLAAGELSAWHRVTDAVEIWHYHAGAPLDLTLCRDGSAATVETHALGLGFEDGERPQVVVPANVWQAARSRGAWTLVGCTVAPAFEFTSHEMAPPGWQPE